MTVPQTRPPTNLRHFPDRIGIGNIALSPHEKESRFRKLGNFYLFYLKILIMESRIQLKESRIPLTTIGIRNPSSTDKYWNPVQSRSTWNPEYTACMESNTVLDFLIWGDAIGGEGETGIPVKNTSRPSNEQNHQHTQL